MPRRGAGDDFDDDSEITGWHHGLGWRRDRDWDRGDMGFGMMRGGGMMGADGMHSGMMMRMLFAMMDSDGEPTAVPELGRRIPCAGTRRFQSSSGPSS
jgi:hypothetical protein